MSRVGKYPVEIPQGVQVAIAGGMLTAKGRLGEMTLKLTEHVQATVEDGKVVVQPHGQEQQARVMWGTTRALVANMVHGVSTGYTKSMEITGTGYRAAVQGKNLELSLGFSPPVVFPVPEGDQGRRGGQAAGWPGGGGNSRVPSARAVQGQGRALQQRADPPQGRQEEVSGRAARAGTIL
jgi:hypothetical protein